MYSWLVKRLTRWLLARLRRGDARPILALMASDVRFRFPGRSSWAADLHSKDDVRRWFDRYLAAGLQLEPLDIAVGGPPWDTVIFTRFTDHATDGNGTVIYENEGVLLDRARWGRIREHSAYEDTERTTAFDRRVGAAAVVSRRGG